MVQFVILVWATVNLQTFGQTVFDIQEMTMNPVYPKDRVIFGNVASICGERYVIIKCSKSFIEASIWW